MNYVHGEIFDFKPKPQIVQILNQSVQPVQPKVVMVANDCNDFTIQDGLIERSLCINFVNAKIFASDHQPVSPLATITTFGCTGCTGNLMKVVDAQ